MWRSGKLITLAMHLTVMGIGTVSLSGKIGSKVEDKAKYAGGGWLHN